MTFPYSTQLSVMLSLKNWVVIKNKKPIFKQVIFNFLIYVTLEYFTYIEKIRNYDFMIDISVRWISTLTII